jgi:acetoin utilization deacetylase AcuC-like enzyme
MAGRPLFFSHPSSLEHHTGGHPESPARIQAVTEELERRDWLGWQRETSPEVARGVLEGVHPSAYVEEIERVCAAGGGALDMDTRVSEGSFEAALRACGGAVAMVEHLVEQGAGSVAFSAHRPPGHHALSARAMGFCLFNNIAVAARHAVEELGLSRVLILDWDVHHGNGTNDIFAETREVLFCSIHQSPLYPGTGAAHDVGFGRGHGYSVNLPVPPGSGDEVFVSLVRDVVLPLGREYSPQLILISAGYDAHRDDPLAECRVSDEGYAALSWLMRDLAVELGSPLGAVLEGGYDVAALARGVAVTMEVFGGGPGAEERPVILGEGEPVALARDALRRLGEDWPGVAGGSA